MTTILHRLRELEQAATPGPWTALIPNHSGAVVTHGLRDVAIVSMHKPRTQQIDDTELIAAARNALPQLLDIAEAALTYKAAVDAPKSDAGIAMGVTYRDLVNALAALDTTEPT